MISLFRQSESRRRWILFSLLSGVVASVWLLLLPYLCNQPHIATRIERLESQGIDPSAMFYTDVEAMPEISARLEAAKARHPNAVWIP